jgi:hypothetical protein
MPLTPNSRIYEEKLANRRKKQQMRDDISKSRFQGNAKPVESFSSPAPKNNVISYNRFGSRNIANSDGTPDFLFQKAVEVGMDMAKDTGISAAQILNEGANQGGGRAIFGKDYLARGAGKLFGQEAQNTISGEVTPMDILNAANIVPGIGGAAGKGASGALKLAEYLVPKTSKFEPAMALASGGMTTRTPIMGNVKDVVNNYANAGRLFPSMLKMFDESNVSPEDRVSNAPDWYNTLPEQPVVKNPVSEAIDILDAPEILSGTKAKKRLGEIPIHIDSQDTANQVFFGDRVSDAGKVGNSVSSNPEFVGTTAHMGRRLEASQIEKDQILVAKNAVKERYEGAAPKNGAGPKIRKNWATTTLNNFVTDFGDSAARVLRSEGRRSIGGEFDEASTIAQTIQHDHTVVSPSDLKMFEAETKELKRSLGSKHPDVVARTNVAKDMRTVLADSRNLVPVHRNPNILFSSFDRERLLNDPEYANSLGINEDNLGDIWKIMSDQNSGYRKSVSDAYAFARSGGRADSVAYWQKWQDANLEKVLTRRNQRLKQSGISLD